MNSDNLTIQLQDIKLYYDVIILTEYWISKDFVLRNIDNLKMYFTLYIMDGVVFYMRYISSTKITYYSELTQHQSGQCSALDS